MKNTTTNTTVVKPRFWSDNFKTHDSNICDCNTCKEIRKSNKQ